MLGLLLVVGCAEATPLPLYMSSRTPTRYYVTVVVSPFPTHTLVPTPKNLPAGEFEATPTRQFILDRWTPDPSRTPWVRYKATPRPTRRATSAPRAVSTPRVVVPSGGARQELIDKQFSIWDGSHPALTKLIKYSMHDPSSYKHVSTYYRDAGTHLVVETTFRGKNAFGAVVTHWVIAQVDFKGNIIQVVSQGYD